MRTILDDLAALHHKDAIGFAAAHPADLVL